MRAWSLLIVLLVGLVPSVASAQCTSLLLGDGCVEADLTPSASLTTTTATVTADASPGVLATVDVVADSGPAEVSSHVVSLAPLYPLSVAFSGPTSALDHEHYLVPDAYGKIAFYSYGIDGQFGGVCGQIPGAAACVPYIV